MHGNDVIKPLAVRLYNLFMGGVDRVDQQLHGIHALRKTYKWYKKLAVRLIMQAALNAHKVFQYTTGKVEVDFLKYLHDVIALLVTITPRMIHDIPLDGTVQRLTGRHFPEQKKHNAGDSGKRPAKSVMSATHVVFEQRKMVKSRQFIFVPHVLENLDSIQMIVS